MNEFSLVYLNIHFYNSGTRLSGGAFKIVQKYLQLYTKINKIYTSICKDYWRHEEYTESKWKSKVNNKAQT